MCVCVLNVHSFSLSETEHNFIHLREIYWLSYKPLSDDVSLFSHGAIVLLGWIFKSLVLRNFLEMWILKILPQVLFVLLFQFCLYFFPPYWHANVLTPISSCLLWLRTVSTFVNVMLLGSLQRNPSVLFYYFDVLFLTHFWIYLQFILVYDVSGGSILFFHYWLSSCFNINYLNTHFSLCWLELFCYLSNFYISKFNPWALHSTSAAFVCTFNELFALGWHSSTKCYLLNANYRLGKQLSALQGWRSGEDLSLMPRTHF